MNRRTFIKQSAAFTAPLVLAAPLRGAAAPSNRITLGFIGVGNHGTHYNLKSFLQEDDCRPVAVCDVFPDRRQKARNMVNQKFGGSDCVAVADFRVLLARDDIDAVVISTPDHWHVPLSLLALDAGKDVFCEKPTLTIEQGRRLADRLKTKPAVFQTGLEDRSVIQYHKLAEAVRNGAIGKLHTIRVGLPYKGAVYPRKDPEPVPEGFNYRMWLGPAPYQPYTAERVSVQGWRQIRDYSGGTLTDWGAHIMDTAQVANFAENSGPVEVEGSGEIPPNALNDLPNRFTLKYTYANGVVMHVKAEGVYLRFEGSDGWCGNKGWRGGLEAHDRLIFRREITENKMWPLPPSEHRNFLDCVRSRQPTTYTAEALHRLSTSMHIGNIAMQLGRKLRWDPAAEVFPGDEEANSLRSRKADEAWKTA